MRHIVNAITGVTIGLATLKFSSYGIGDWQLYVILSLACLLEAILVTLIFEYVNTER
jgi:hypothetical protein